MTAILLAAFCALAARGFHETAAGLALGTFAFGAMFDLTYVVRRVPARLREPRRRLDQVVRFQLAAILLIGVGVPAVLAARDSSPLEDTSTVLQTLIVGVTFGATTVYLSSLLDWYWILPKVSGATGPGPCEAPGLERWAGVTKLWFFHRAVATASIIGVLAAVPGYLAGISKGGGTGAAWALLGALLSIGYSSFNVGLSRAFLYAFNPPVHVGDVIRVRPTEESELQQAVIVDVSVQGAKYKLVKPHLEAPKPRFTKKGQSLSMEQVSELIPLDDPQAMCTGPEGCRAINWYCCRNARAHGDSHFDDGKGTPLE
jgi:hypothetical protein